MPKSVLTSPLSQRATTNDFAIIYKTYYNIWDASLSVYNNMINIKITFICNESTNLKPLVMQQTNLERSTISMR